MGIDNVSHETHWLNSSAGIWSEHMPGADALGCALSFGPLTAVVADPQVTDVVVTCDGEVWVDRGAGMQRISIAIPLRPSAVLREFAVRLCAQLGCRLDEASPIADAAAADGTRVHAVIAPIVAYGASISIRLPDRTASHLDELVINGLCPDWWGDVLRRMVGCRASMLIVGGTGAGKTTLLKALLQECGSCERIITVEEVRELGAVHHPHLVSLVTRASNVEGAGAIPLTQLVRATLRMRPDRIVVGECRGEEIADLLRALNSGHRGGMTTLHANGICHVPSRLMALGLLAGLDPDATAMLAARAFDVVIFVERHGVRRFISQIGVLETVDGVLAGRMLSCWDGVHDPVVGDGWHTFLERWSITVSGTDGVRRDTGAASATECVRERGQ